MDALARALAYASPEYTPVPPPSNLHILTNDELCQGWLSSFLALQEQSTSSRMAGVVAERQRYLDEFERRSPSGFAAWLGSGARPPGNPRPLLTSDCVEPLVIDWDELIRRSDY
jgi:hypothetical protein